MANGYNGCTAESEQECIAESENSGRNTSSVACAENLSHRNSNWTDHRASARAIYRRAEGFDTENG